MLYLSMSFSYEDNEHNWKKKPHKNRRNVQICTQCKIAYRLVGLFHTCHSFKELRGKIISEPDLGIRLVL